MNQMLKTVVQGSTCIPRLQCHKKVDGMGMVKKPVITILYLRPMTLTVLPHQPSLSMLYSHPSNKRNHEYGLFSCGISRTVSSLYSNRTRFPTEW
jgi:hypothetical protein